MGTNNHIDFEVIKTINRSQESVDNHVGYNPIHVDKDFTVGQVKVIAVVVIIISGMIFIIAIIRYRTTCRRDNCQVNQLSTHHPQHYQHYQQQQQQQQQYKKQIDNCTQQVSLCKVTSPVVIQPSSTKRSSVVLLRIGRSATITKLNTHDVRLNRVKKCSSTIGICHFEDQTPLLTSDLTVNAVQTDVVAPVLNRVSITKRTSKYRPAYRKEFMQKIERFRFIDDSASSTTTVTSPVESIDRIHCQDYPVCHQLISSAIEQFDDYVRSRYEQQDEINTYIDRLNADMLTNGSYSDLNILNNPNPTRRFEPVAHAANSHPISSTSIVIPSPGSSSSSSTQSLSRPTSISTSKSDLVRPIPRKAFGTFYDTSSSSQGTLTSIRSSTSLEFDDDRKPSGVLVEDGFIPMSSPVDEHFWDMSILKNSSRPSNGCFPNVGSSPDIEEKSFYPTTATTTTTTTMTTMTMPNVKDQLQSETSCDEDDEEEISVNEQTFSIQQYHLKELQKPTFNPSPTKDLISVPIQRLSLDRSQQDESLLEKFAAAAHHDYLPFATRSPPLRSNVPSNEPILSTQTIYEEDDTQDSSTNDNGSDESADNGEIDLVQEFEMCRDDDDHEIFLVQDDDLLSALVNTPTVCQTPPSLPSNSLLTTNNNNHRPLPPSIMKVHNHKSVDSLDDVPPLKPKVRFNLDPEYEREREWNKVNKLLGNSVEWTDEFEV